MVAAAYVLWFEHAANMDSRLPDDERHFVDELDWIMSGSDYLEEPEEAFDAEQQRRDMEAMAQLGRMVNEAYLGGGD